MPRPQRKGAGQINKLHYTVASGTNYPLQEAQGQEAQEQVAQGQEAQEQEPQEQHKQAVHTYFISSDEDEPMADSSAGGAGGSSSGV
jgi:hypothetical protein